MRSSSARLLLLPLAVQAVASFVYGCHNESPPVASPAVPGATAPTPAAAASPVAATGPLLKGPDEAALDRSVSPCDDFYQFACGGWMKATPIPDDQSSWSRSFSTLHEESQKALRGILERDAQGDTRGDAYGDRLGTLWTSCMDEPAVEKNALADLKPELARIDAVNDKGSLIGEIAHLHSIGVPAAFAFDSEIDMKDATRMIAGLSQGGLGLPERDYYFRQDARTNDIRAEYEKHIARMFELLGDKPKTAEANAKVVVKLETDLAGASMTNVELRDPQKLYHRLDLDGLKKLAPDLAWDAYLSGLGSSSIRAINVAQPDFVKKLDAMAQTVPAAQWRTYLRWHLTRRMAPLMSQKFVSEWFHFRQVLTGAKTLEPRWKRCVTLADRLMGEALAQPFVKENLGEDGKQTAAQMVADIEAMMKGDLDALPWMDGATRSKAYEKLGRIMNKIGYPAKWRSYDGLAIRPGSLIANAQAAYAFDVKRKLDKVGKPVDKDEWEMTPPTVNAYYEPTRNEMVFPAGILRPPFYGATQTPALNFGAIGMVVGHELTHGFDDEGRQFDADGNLRDWWTPSVSAEFDRRAGCVEKQFDDYVAIEDAHIKGKLTLGENLADLGGMKLSLAAFLRAEKAHGAAPPAGGFNSEQQFFVGFAQAWCTNMRPEAMRLLVATNPHSPSKFRVIGPLSNMPAFASAFQCKEGSPMVRAQRCEVW